MIQFSVYDTFYFKLCLSQPLPHIAIDYEQSSVRGIMAHRADNPLTDERVMDRLSMEYLKRVNQKREV